MKGPSEESTLSGEPTLSMGVGLFTPSLLRGATISCTVTHTEHVRGCLTNPPRHVTTLEFGSSTGSFTPSPLKELHKHSAEHSGRLSGHGRARHCWPQELHMQPFKLLMTTWDFRLGNVLRILTVSLPSPASSYTTSVHGSSQRGCDHSMLFQMQGV